MQPTNLDIYGCVQYAQVRCCSFLIATSQACYSSSSIPVFISNCHPVVLGNAAVTVSLFSSSLNESVSNNSLSLVNFGIIGSKLNSIYRGIASLKHNGLPKDDTINSCWPFHIFRDVLLFLTQVFVCSKISC